MNKPAITSFREIKENINKSHTRASVVRNITVKQGGFLLAWNKTMASSENEPPSDSWSRRVSLCCKIRNNQKGTNSESIQRYNKKRKGHSEM